MSEARSCPPIEALFEEAQEHARSCEACAGILEEHRQLEKDLFRLADPLPPADFVHRVMAKVAAAPAPVRADVRTALAILGVAVALAVVSFLASQGTLGSFGVAYAQGLTRLREVAVGISSGLSAVWLAAALPVTAGLVTTLFLSLVGLRRLAGASS